MPVFAESDESFNLDPDRLESKITPHTKAIMVVHTHGLPRRHGRDHVRRREARVSRFWKTVPRAWVPATGASRWGRSAMSACTASRSQKRSRSGEGGGLVTNDPLLYERAARYHDLGILRAPHEALLGGARLEGLIGNQYRMSEFTGAVLLAQLRKLDTIVAALRGHAGGSMKGLPTSPGCIFATCLTPRGRSARTSG